jgi:hypothetical protein
LRFGRPIELDGFCLCRRKRHLFDLCGDLTNFPGNPFGFREIQFGVDFGC